MCIFCIHLGFYTSTGTEPLTVLSHQHILSPLVSVFISPNSKFSDTKAELSLDVKDEAPEISIWSTVKVTVMLWLYIEMVKELIHRT